jgi:nitrogen fixation/metabolism regulation signal transduction histidine kinase
VDLSGGNERLRQFVEELRARFAAGREEWREQIELNVEGTAPRVLACACVPLAGGDAAAAPTYVIVFDEITELLQAQREAAWGEVARRLAHEIKNPLTPIQLSAERMRHKLLAGLGEQDAQVLDRGVHTIVQQVETMKRMVNAFSEYARSPAMQVSPVDLNQLVGEVADLYRAQAGAVAIRTELDRTLGEVDADRGRLRQILNNLVTNSLEALEGAAEPRIEIRTEAAAGEAEPGVVLTVSDNGPGIPRELLARIFEPYVTSKPRGTGLGLAIVKRLVEEHGGRIEAENQPEGGARLRVMLPLRHRSRASAARERVPELRRERA